jgi:magnesium-transporting ATPase (P-type)
VTAGRGDEDDGRRNGDRSGELREGDPLLIRPGQRVQTDGTIVRASSTLDEAVITGKSRPVERDPDDAVIAATINTWRIVPRGSSSAGCATAASGSAITPSRGPPANVIKNPTHTAHAIRARRSRNEFVTTLTELNAIAALARIGLSISPNAG